MANKMQGLLGDPLFQMGAGILANNTGHYGAFGPAVGQGMLSGMQQNRQMQALQLRQQEAAMQKKLYELQLKEANKPSAYTLSPGSRRYEGGKQVSYNPSRGTDPKQTQMEQLIKLRDRFPIGSPDYKSVQNQITKLGTITGTTEFDPNAPPLTPTQTGTEYLSREQAKNSVLLADKLLGRLDKIGTPYMADARASVSGLIGGAGEALGMPALTSAAEAISPPDLEAFRSEATIWLGMLKEPLMKERRMSDQDRQVLERATAVLSNARSGAQMRNAVTSVRDVVNRFYGLNEPKHPEGQEWVGEDGRKRKMVDGRVKVFVE